MYFCSWCFENLRALIGGWFGYYWLEVSIYPPHFNQSHVYRFQDHTGIKQIPVALVRSEDVGIGWRKSNSDIVSLFLRYGREDS